MPVRSRDDILAPIRCEAPQPIEEIEIVARQSGGRGGFGAAGPGWHKARHSYLRNAAAVDLVRQQSPAVGDDSARDRLEQNAVLVGNLLRRSHEDPTRSIHHVGFDTRGNQPHDLFME